MTYEELQQRYMHAKEKFERNELEKKLRNDMSSFVFESHMALRRVLNKKCGKCRLN